MKDKIILFLLDVILRILNGMLTGLGIIVSLAILYKVVG